MKNIIAVVLMLAVGSLAMASTGRTMASGLDKTNKAVGKGIEFYHGTWDQALKLASKEKKLIFLDAYAAWCGPCKIMASKTFTDDEVGDFFNKNFINVKMDMEKNADGPRLSKKYRLTAYPSLYFVDSNEKIILQELGYHKPKELIAVGEAALKK